jgi:hypothetical protein
MRSLLSLSAVLIAAVAIACSTGDPAEPRANDITQVDSGVLPSAIAGRDCPSMSPLTYQSFGGPFFSNYCTGCHSSKQSAENRRGAPAGVDFDTLGGIRAHAARIYARAGDHNTTMPPAGGPSADQRTQLGDWLACGAPGDEQTMSAPSLPPKETMPAECGDRPSPLPAAVLPRCSAATWECIAKCDTLEYDCGEKCLAADTTPPNTDYGSPFGCGDCINYQQYACTDANGCHDVVAALECCRRDKCATSTDPYCLSKQCQSEIYAYGYCLYSVTPTCASLAEGPARQCFPANLATDAGAD